MNKLRISKTELSNKRIRLGDKRKLFESVLKQRSIKNPKQIQQDIIRIGKDLEEVNEKIEKFKELKENFYEDNIDKYKRELKNISKQYRKNDNDLQLFDNKISDLTEFKIELEGKLSSLSFQDKSVEILQSIPFETCPNCKRSLEQLQPSNFCSLCKREIDTTPTNIEKEREVRYLNDTIQEIDSQIDIIDNDMNFIEEEMNTLMEKQLQLRDLIKKNIEIDSIPFIDDLQNLFNEKYNYHKDMQKNKSDLQLWDFNKSLTESINQCDKKLRIIDNKIEEYGKIQTNEEKIQIFIDTFKNLISNFPKIRKYDKVGLSIKSNKEDYLPTINGKIYTDDTGDAEKVLIIAMYHLCLLELFEKNIGKFPSLLIIDTPRQQELTRNDYQKEIDLFYEKSKNLQIILCVTEKIHLEENKYNRIYSRRDSHFKFTINKSYILINIV